MSLRRSFSGSRANRDRRDDAFACSVIAEAERRRRDGAKIRILLVDQFDGISPHWLAKNPVKFDALVAGAMSGAFAGFRAPQVLDVAEDFLPPMATTALREGADGWAEVWKYRWDTSG